MKVRWDTKLGYSNELNIRNLKSLRNNGGKVELIDVFVIKKYPLIEKTQKTRPR